MVDTIVRLAYINRWGGVRFRLEPTEFTYRHQALPWLLFPPIPSQVYSGIVRVRKYVLKYARGLR